LDQGSGSALGGGQPLHQGVAGVQEPMNRALWLGALSLVLVPALARAQRPDEGDLFGKPDEAADAGTPALDGGAGAGTAATESRAPTPKTPEDNRDTEALAQGIKDQLAPGGEVVEDPLKIGGRFYLQANASGGYGQDVRDGRFSSPTLVDGYFD